MGLTETGTHLAFEANGEGVTPPPRCSLNGRSPSPGLMNSNAPKHL